VSDEIPSNPIPTGEPKKSGLLSKATQAAKTGVEKTQKKRAEAQATQAAQVQQDAIERAAQRQAYIVAGHHFYEYSVTFLREGLIGDKINTVELQNTMNRWANEGWRVKAVTSASGPDA